MGVWSWARPSALDPRGGLLSLVPLRTRLLFTMPTCSLGQEGSLTAPAAGPGPATPPAGGIRARGSTGREKGGREHGSPSDGYAAGLRSAQQRRHSLAPLFQVALPHRPPRGAREDGGGENTWAQRGSIQGQGCLCKTFPSVTLA